MFTFERWDYLNRPDFKKGFIVLVLCILIIGYILSNIGHENKLEGYSVAINFFGIFATFGGAYVGAKIAGIMLENFTKNKRRNRMIIHIKRST